MANIVLAIRRWLRRRAWPHERNRRAQRLRQHPKFHLAAARFARGKQELINTLSPRPVEEAERFIEIYAALSEMPTIVTDPQKPTRRSQQHLLRLINWCSATAR